MLTLLTGATGYIGSHVLERLVARGDAVRVLALPETVEQVRHRDRVSIIEGSLADGTKLHEATRGVEVVYHLGALLPNSPRRDLLCVNVHGTENLMRASVTAGVRRFVFTSSVAVYKRAPWPLLWPISEDFPLKTPDGSRNLRIYAQSKSAAEPVVLRLHCYAQSKLAAESVILRLHRQHRLEYVILRSTEVYGPPRPLWEQLIKQVINDPAQVLSRAAYISPMQWVHVSDFAEAVVRAGTLPQAANHVFNIAGSELFVLPALIPIVWRIMGRGSWVEPFPYQIRTRGYSHLKYDFSKAQKLLGYAPKVRLQEGLQDLVTMISNG